MTEEDEMTKKNTDAMKTLGKRWGVSPKQLQALVDAVKREEVAPLVRGVGIKPEGYDDDAVLLEAFLTTFAALDLDFGNRMVQLRAIAGNESAAVAHGIVKRHLRPRGIGRG